MTAPMRFSPALAASSLLVLLASCVGPPSRTPAPARALPAPPPAPQASPAPPTPPALAWEDRALTPGSWSYRQDAGGSAALFGSAGQSLFTLRCDPASRRITALRAGAGQGAMVIRTSYGAVSWPATLDAGAQPQVIATRAATDSALDQMAYSRGKIGVEVQGLSPLIVPAWAEVARVVEDCRG